MKMGECLDLARTQFDLETNEAGLLAVICHPVPGFQQAVPRKDGYYNWGKAFAEKQRLILARSKEIYNASLASRG